MGGKRGVGVGKSRGEGGHLEGGELWTGEGVREELVERKVSCVPVEDLEGVRGQGEKRGQSE